MDEVPGEKNLPSPAELFELRLRNVVTETAATEEIEDQEGAVESQAAGGRVPYHYVSHQVHLCS